MGKLQETGKGKGRMLNAPHSTLKARPEYWELQSPRDLEEENFRCVPNPLPLRHFPRLLHLRKRKAKLTNGIRGGCIRSWYLEHCHELIPWIWLVWHLPKSLVASLQPSFTCLLTIYILIYSSIPLTMLTKNSTMIQSSLAMFSAWHTHSWLGNFNLIFLAKSNSPSCKSHSWYSTFGSHGKWLLRFLHITTPLQSWKQSSSPSPISYSPNFKKPSNPFLVLTTLFPAKTFHYLPLHSLLFLYHF